MTLLTQETSQTIQLTRQICSDWLDGATPDARAALREHPELAEDLSAVLDLAYAEFCLRRDAGEVLDPERFTAEFPEIHSQLLRVLGVDQTLAAHRSIIRDESDQPLIVWPKPGDEVGRCRLVRELGRGAFSRVYLALESSAGNRPVALKLCRSAHDEARTLGRLHHDHVVPILWADHDEFWQLDVVCMPFLGSVTLADVFEHLYPSNQSLPPRDAGAILDALKAREQPDDPAPDLVLFGQPLRGRSFVEGVAGLALTLAETLAFLHARGLYHCDLKPSNLLLTAGGRLMLLDFNLSRVEGIAPRLVGGTFQYMAPEQLRAHAAGQGIMPQTAQADLFSFGVILYEWLTGRRPFGSPPVDLPKKDVPGWFLERTFAGFIPPRRLNPQIPCHLVDLIERCLEVDPKRRPASAAEVVRLLRPERSRQMRAAVIATCSLFLAIGVLLGATRSKPTPAGVEEPTSNLLERADRAAAVDELTRATQRLANGQRDLALADLESASARYHRLLGSPDDASEPVQGNWKDHLNQAHALILLKRPSKARKHLELAERLQRREFLQSSTWPLLLASPLSLTALSGATFSREMAGDLAKILACRSRVEAQEGHHVQAILYGQKAVELGSPNAALLNNLGYSAMKRGNFPLARHYLAQALCLNPFLAPALFNSCQLVFQESLQTRAILPDFLLDDLEVAIELLQQQRIAESSETYRFASDVFARSALDLRRQGYESDSAKAELRRREQRSRDFLERACVLGLNPNFLTRNDFLREVLGEEFLQPERLLALRQQEHQSVIETYLANPLEEPLR